MDSDADRAKLVRLSAPLGAHVQCAPSYFSGSWDAVVVPALHFFSTPAMRKGPDCGNILVYGPEHLFRAAWLAGARDYLREPWSPEELFLRLRGPMPSSVSWKSTDQTYRLEGRVLSTETGAQIRCSSAEAAVLRTLALRQGSSVSRSVLAWAAHCSEGRVVDTLVTRLRRRLRDLGAEDTTIVAVRGVGYRLP